MASRTWRTRVRAAAAACIVAGSTAQAAVFYQSDFDPVGFAGSAIWKVNDNCLSGGVLTDGYRGVNLLGSCDVALFSLQAQLWNGGASTAAAAASDPTRVTVNFGSDLANPFLVAGIWVAGGALAGVDTFLIGPQHVNNVAAGGSLNNNFGVQFTSGRSPLGFLAPAFGNNAPALGNLANAGAYLWEEGYNWLTRPLNQIGLCPDELWASFVCAKEVVVTDNASGYAPFVTGRAFVQIPDPTQDPTVPEPGSIALVLGALGGAWFVRRRSAG